MDVPVWAWLVTIGVILAMLAVDYVGHVRTPHAPSLREASWWSAGYVAVAVLFGGIVWAVWGSTYGASTSPATSPRRACRSTTSSSSCSS